MNEIYHRPKTRAQALGLLAQGNLRIGAGFTDIFPATQDKELRGPVLDISAIPDLNGIQHDSEGIMIGATTTWSQIARAELPPSLIALQQAAVEVGAKQIQNRGTLGGNLCNASPAADGVPALLILDAEVCLASATHERRVPLEGFIQGPRQTALRPGELVTGIHIPAPSLSGHSTFLKLGARRYLVISIAMVAIRLVIENGLIQQAALALGACGPRATRLADAEAALIGQAPDPYVLTADLIQPYLAPIDDARADAAYRADAALELLRRGVSQFQKVAA